jgi:hypothetical protein
MVVRHARQRWVMVVGISLGCGDAGGDVTGGDTDTTTGGPTVTSGVTEVGDTSSGSTAAEPTTASPTDATSTTGTTGTTGPDAPTTGDDDTDSSSTGPAVLAECDDGLDNDGDGFTDGHGDFGCYGPADRTEAALPRAEEDGFTTYEFAADSLVIYVSNAGDDAADGLTPATAVATITHAAGLVRDGEHDFMLLRRGDVWRDQDLYRFKSGRDAEHPLVIGGYGDSLELPRIEVAESFIDHDGQARSNVALIGLHFVSYPGDPADPGFTGEPGTTLRYVGGGADLLVEGCHFEYGELTVQSCCDAPEYDNVELRRNVVERAYHRDTCVEDDPNGNFEFRPSGLYASHAHRLTVEGNLFDHNGWNPDGEPTACATIYNHNLYVNGTDMVIRDNFLARASSMHIKVRSDTPGDVEGLRVDNNFFVEGEIGVGLGGNTDEPYRFVNGELRNNVLTDIGRSQPTGRTLAWSIDITDNDGLTIADNLVLNNRQPGVTNAYGLNIEGGSARAYQIENNLFWRLQSQAIRIRAQQAHTEVVLVDNQIVDPELDARLIDFGGSFAGYTFQGNQYRSSAGDDAWFNIGGQGQVSLADWIAASGETDAAAFDPAFPDPERDAEAYAVEIGAGSTLPDLLAAARLQTRLNWRTELTAPAINTWIRAGFGR